MTKFYLFLLATLFLINTSFAQTCTISIRNDVVVSSTEYQFDIYMLRTGPTSFSYSGATQFIITFNNAGIGGSGLSYAMVPGCSELDPVQVAALTGKFSVNLASGQLRMAAAAPNLASATIISNIGYGTRIARMKLTSATPFNIASPNLALLMTGSIRTKVFGTVDNVVGVEYTNPSGSVIGNVSGNVTFISELSNPALPVELTSFTAKADKRDIALNWITKTEYNTSSFIIERKGAKDADWKSAGNVASSGNSNSPKEYSFIDKKLNSGKYSYRLKMVDKDGSHKYSDVIEAEIELPKTYAISQNYPNPFNPSTRIDYQLPNDSRVTLEIFSMTGEKVGEIVNQDQSAGYYTVDMNSYTLNRNLASGIYIYRMVAQDNITHNNFVNVKKMMMLK